MRISFVWFFGVVLLGAVAFVACDGKAPVGEQVAENTVSESDQEKADVESGSEANALDGSAESSIERQSEQVLPETTAEQSLPETTAEQSLPETSAEQSLPETSAEQSLPEPKPELGPEPRPEPQPDGVLGADYSKDGPMMVSSVPRRDITLPTSTGCGKFCKVFLEVSYPDGNSIVGPYPLVLFSNGFLLKSSYYASYAKRFASWGYVVVRWDTDGEDPTPLFGKGVIDHDALGKMIVELISWADTQSKDPASPLRGKLDASKTYAVGHSRGGKASALAAGLDPRIKLFFGIDPVNANPPLSSKRIDSFPELAKSSAPVGVVGSDNNTGGFQPCTPPQDSYSKFYDAVSRSAWEMLVVKSGHMQFLDNTTGCGFTCSACPDGSTPSARVRELTQTMMIAWGEKHFRAADITAYQGAWSQQLTQSGQGKFRNK